MNVKFISVTKIANDRAYRANSEHTAAVGIVPFKVFYRLEMDRFAMRTNLTPAALDAIREKWMAEPKLKTNPKMDCEQTKIGYIVTTISIPITEAALEGWKVFLGDLLSRSDSWQVAPRPPLSEKVKRMAQGTLAKKKEANLWHQSVVELIDTGYKVLAVKRHPDKGGSHEDMVRLTKARDFLKGVIK